MSKLAPNPVFMPEYDVIRATLVRARTNTGVSQKELGERIGRSAAHIALIETGQRKLDLLETFFVFEALGIEPATVVGSLFNAISRSRKGAAAALAAS
jgi:transcriptional regulator with XRE-family HTH domain